MDSELKNRIKEIDWESLNHAFGSAKDIPPMLLGLLSDETDSSEIFDVLSNTIIHQGTIYSATCYALPFLIDITKIYSYPDIRRLVGLILYITYNIQHEERCLNAVSENFDVFINLFKRLETQEVIDCLETQLDLVSILGYCERKKDDIIIFLKDQINSTSNNLIITVSILSLFKLDFPNQLKNIEARLNSIDDCFVEFVILLKLLEYYKKRTPKEYLEKLKKYLEDYKQDYRPFSEKIDYLIDKFYFYDALDDHLLSIDNGKEEFDFHALIYE